MKKAVLVSCFNWYKTRVEPVRALLLECGYETSVILSDFNHITKKRITKKNSDCCYIHVPSYEKNISLNRIRSHLFFGKKTAFFLKQEKPDLIYLLLPPNNIAKYCTQYKKNNPNTKLIIDIIDLWPESMPIGFIKKTPFVWFWKKWRDNAIKIADYVFTECDLYQDKLVGVVDPSKTTTLHLYKEQTEEEKQLVQSIVNCKERDDVIRFAYLGSMNNIIDIEGICKVLKIFISSGKKCELHAIGDGVSRNIFEQLVRDVGVKTYFYGPLFDEIEKIKILAPCDYAFNMMKECVNVGLTIKSIDYLSYGLPLINNIKGDTWNLVDEQNIGFNFTGKNILAEDFDHNRILSVFENQFAKESFVRTVKIHLF